MTVIVGAGLAGLLAGNMLHHAIIEEQPHLPNNHNSILRFRTSQIGDVLGIPFKKVILIKAVHTWRNPVADALAYSMKNTGFMRSDRSIIAGLVVDERFIAPPDLITQMADPLSITYRYPFTNQMKEPVISTIPMPTLMKLLDYSNQPTFSHRNGFTVTATVDDCDAYVSLMVPDPAYPFSRISLTANQLIIECTGEVDRLNTREIAIAAAQLLGIHASLISNATFAAQRYAKILPIPEEARRDFIYWASTNHNVYSLGRFATWRPGLLLDDLVKDIRLIAGWINGGDNYSRRSHWRQ